jgi:hypothetical protein
MTQAELLATSTLTVHQTRLRASETRRRYHSVLIDSANPWLNRREVVNRLWWYKISSADSCSDQTNVTPPLQPDLGHVVQDPGYLHLDAQSKGTYLSPSFFASITQDVGCCKIARPWDISTDPKKLSEISALIRRQRGYSTERPSQAGSNTVSSTGQRSSRSSHSQAASESEAHSWQVYGDYFTAGADDEWRSDHQFPALQDISVSTVLESLPDDETVKALLAAYFEGCHTIRPVFDQRSFTVEAGRLMSWSAK